MIKFLVLGSIATVVAWVVCRRRPREVANVESRCADIAEWARRARVTA